MAAKRARVKRRRRNPAAPALKHAQLHGMRGTLLGIGLEEITYKHAQSVSSAVYTHDFDGDEQLWAMADGSLVIRHPRRRLWADFIVRDSE
jgi:hypothetical protein